MSERVSTGRTVIITARSGIIVTSRRRAILSSGTTIIPAIVHHSGAAVVVIIASITVRVISDLILWLLVETIHGLLRSWSRSEYAVTLLDWFPGWHHVVVRASVSVVVVVVVVTVADWSWSTAANFLFAIVVVTVGCVAVVVAVADRGGVHFGLASSWASVASSASGFGFLLRLVSVFARRDSLACALPISLALLSNPEIN